MTRTETLTQAIGQVIQDIIRRREEIKDAYCKAWLASIAPETVNLDWIIQNVELVEQWSDNMRTVTWHMRLKSKPRAISAKPSTPA